MYMDADCCEDCEKYSRAMHIDGVDTVQVDWVAGTHVVVVASPIDKSRQRTVYILRGNSLLRSAERHAVLLLLALKMFSWEKKNSVDRRCSAVDRR